jgi:hypothetical protein
MGDHLMNTETIDPWVAPRAGHWRRDFRLGEWLHAPVTPSFATWLLPEVERGFSEAIHGRFGFGVRLPLHVIVNGWYFTNDGKFDGMVKATLRQPRTTLAQSRAMATMATHPERGQKAMAEPGLRAYRDELFPAHVAEVRARPRPLSRPLRTSSSALSFASVARPGHSCCPWS